MGGYLPVFIISIGGKPFALTGHDDVLKPENEAHIICIIRALFARRKGSDQPTGEVTVREATYDEGGAYETAIMQDDIDEKWAKLREEAALTPSRDWKGLESIDWVLLE